MYNLFNRRPNLKGYNISLPIRAFYEFIKGQRKKEIFFIGEVFFLLTRPLMGDPIPSQMGFQRSSRTFSSTVEYYLLT
jgi:hypothetical protein